MNRRIVLLGMSAAATPLLANTLVQSARAQGATEGLQQYRMQTLQFGTLSKETSVLALQRAQSGKVKEFAGFENAEQTTISQVLTDQQNPTPPTLEPKNAAILQNLRQTRASGSFDHDYVSAQLQVHEQLLNIQDEFLKSAGSMASDPVHVAMLARTVIEMHIQMLHDIQTMLRA